MTQFRGLWKDRFVQCVTLQGEIIERGRDEYSKRKHGNISFPQGLPLGMPVSGEIIVPSAAGIARSAPLRMV